MRKVFIITEGGKNVGFGHLARCVSLSQAFEERSISPVFIINGDKSVCNILGKRKYFIFDWLKEKKRLLETVRGSAICIVDSYMCDERFYKEISNNVDLAVYVDDNNRLKYDKGVVLNGSVYATTLNYAKDREISYLLGTNYTLIRREFWNMPNIKIKKAVNRVLVTFGGDDKRQMTPLILNLLKNEYPQFRKLVVIGGGFRSIEKIDSLKDSKTKFIHNPSSEKMKRIMIRSDIAISAAGQTLYELARVGIPTIGVCVAKNQLKNAKGWEKAGFLEYAGRFNDGNLKKRVKRSIERFKSVKVRKQRSKIAKLLIGGSGSQTAVKAILSQWFENNLSLRKARIQDARDILNLFNERRVREGSFDPKIISWDHHLGWMKKRMKDKDCVLFIISVSNQFYGQIRFDIDKPKNEAAISFSLVKSARGLNLSSYILNIAVNTFFAERPDINSINAYIREKNIPSIRAFKKAGFNFQKNIKINRYKTKFYARGK
ncbi:MAG: UDP-2,4-diacetamido-2,4,6-trideoxy-beta-L-altropyranose hydrolase [Candidatus Omnitrophica bacterium]|nr:UDP-2,4-diacetamido-2,4,6-trideoxy-beta-L-altropyranose hydrolase [Candidatus Omnitrophota bacterium]